MLDDAVLIIPIENTIRIVNKVHFSGNELLDNFHKAMTIEDNGVGEGFLSLKEFLHKGNKSFLSEGLIKPDSKDIYELLVIYTTKVDNSDLG